MARHSTSLDGALERLRHIASPRLRKSIADAVTTTTTGHLDLSLQCLTGTELANALTEYTRALDVVAFRRDPKPLEALRLDGGSKQLPLCLL